MRHKPDKPYNGLTVVLSQPSRKDTGYLISGYAGIMFNEFLQKHNTSRWCCDIRLSDSLNEPLLPDTKGILLLGEPALHKWCPTYTDYKITEVRGTPLKSIHYVPTIASFTPQDCCDMQNHEVKFNPLLQDAEDDEEKEDADALKSRHGATQRKNFRFWLGQDIQKILHRISNKEVYDSSKFNVRIYPRYEEIIEALYSVVNTRLYFDIETTLQRDLTVIGFSSENSSTIYSLPIHDYNFMLYYGRNTYGILRAIASCLSRNEVVIHNSMFDLFMLLWKYRIPIGRRVYDTMLAQARCFPEVEKSLGHSLSCHPQIWEPYHKDEGVFEPKNQQQERQLLEYNAKDVIALRLLWRAQQEMSGRDVGLKDSIEQANLLPYSYLMNTLTGFRVDDVGIAAKLVENDRILNQYLRFSKMLTGPLIEVLPSSPQQIVKYFHGALEYPVVGRSKKTDEPSLDGTNLFKLKLKYPMNAMIDLCIKYRIVKKFSGSLKAKPIEGWHD